MCALVPHGPAVDLHRSPFILQIYGPVFTPSSFFLPVDKTLYIQYFPFSLKTLKGPQEGEFIRVRKLVCSRFYSRLCFSMVTVFHPLLSGRYVNCIACAGVSVCVCLLTMISLPVMLHWTCLLTVPRHLYYYILQCSVSPPQTNTHKQKCMQFTVSLVQTH